VLGQQFHADGATAEHVAAGNYGLDDANEWRLKRKCVLTHTHTHTRYMRPLLVIPSTRRTTLGDRAFPVTAARAWNALPSSVRSAPSLLHFRRDLKTELHVSVIVLFTIVFGCVTDYNCNL